MSIKEKRLKALKKARTVLARNRKAAKDNGSLRMHVRARLATIAREEVERALNTIA